MSKEGRFVRRSKIEEEALICRHQLNNLGILHGGELVKLIDEIAARCAAKHSGHVCVTASFDGIHILGPILINETVELRASVNRVFGTSMEVGVKVFAKREEGEKHIATAYLNFVAFDNERKPTEVIPIIPETANEKRRYREAVKRRKLRLATRPKKAK